MAFEIFDWLRSLNEQMHPEFAGLLDVFTYTTMIVSVQSARDVRCQHEQSQQQRQQQYRRYRHVPQRSE